MVLVIRPLGFLEDLHGHNSYLLFSVNVHNNSIFNVLYCDRNKVPFYYIIFYSMINGRVSWAMCHCGHQRQRSQFARVCSHPPDHRGQHSFAVLCLEPPRGTYQTAYMFNGHVHNHIGIIMVSGTTFQIQRLQSKHINISWFLHKQ